MARLRVLLVEDNPADVLMVQELFSESRGPVLEVVVAERLEKALELTRRERFDVVLMDLCLPDSDGIESLIRLREQMIATPVIVLTHLDSEEMALQAARHGAQDYLVKGQFSSAELVRSMRYARERHRTDEGLRAREEHTRLIIDTALDAVVTIDTSGVITGWSPQAERTFGWTAEEVIGKLLGETIVPAAYRERHRRGLERLMATGQPRLLNKRLELAAVDRQGRDLPVELSITKICVDGRVFFSAFIRDISERRRAEADLRTSEEKLRTLAESLPNLIWTCRADGWCDFLSRQWLDYTGQPEAEQLGDGWTLHVHPQDLPSAQAAWARAVARGELYDVEFRIRRHDGVYRWFKTRGVPCRDGTGKVVKWCGSNTDIDDHKNAEWKLRMQLERLGLLDQTTRAIGNRQDPRSILQVVVCSLEEHLAIDFACACLINADRSKLAVTCIGPISLRVAESLAMHETQQFEIEAAGLSRCVAGELVHELDLAHKEFPFLQRLAQAGLDSLVSAPLVVENTVFGVLLAARRSGDGFTSEDCKFLRQLSEHVALAIRQGEVYASLQLAYEDLRDTQQSLMQHERLRMVGQMASGIAHDINNALSPAALYVQLLREREHGLTPQAQEHLQVVQRSIDDVANTVGRMKEFYRRNQSQTARTEVDLGRIAEQVLELTRVRWSDMPQERGVVIRVETRYGQGLPRVGGVESELRDALTNLVMNAVDAMPEGGTLTVQTRVASGDRVAIEVADTGIGMDEQTRVRCLEPFFTTKGARGTGLGLPMVYGTLERHEGKIEIESEPGKGTCMRLTFPATHASQVEDRPVAAGAVPVRPLRILLVEDDPIVLRTMRAILECDGHFVIAADGGEKGIQAFRAAAAASDPFSIVITDLGMPYVDGRKVATAVKAERADTPVLMLTGWGQGMQSAEERPAHVDRVLSKPPNLAELRAALAELTTLSSSTCAMNSAA